MVGPITTPRPKRPLARPSSSGGKVSIRIDCEVEKSAPPPTPWMKRKATSSQMFVACPQKKDATVKRTIEPAK
jgi:hypothetical protein